MNFKEELNQRIAYIEETIKTFLPKEEGFQKKVMEAMNYSILAGGKRLRPMLILETYTLFQGTNKKIVEPFMAAMEMIHTYSLVHDDLPAMDNDDYRRGRKTTHIVYGEAMGILAGDALLNYAFETACRAFDFGEDTLQIAEALKVLAAKPGIYGMIGGQAVDVENCDKPLEKEKLDYIYKLKTSALMEASMMIGAILAGAAKEQISQMEEIAADLGLAFQIQDDILDVTSTTQVLGKPIHSDEKNQKTTYVSLEGMEAAKEQVRILSERAIKGLEGFPVQNAFLRELMINLIYREK